MMQSGRRRAVSAGLGISIAVTLAAGSAVAASYGGQSDLASGRLQETAPKVTAVSPPPTVTAAQPAATPAVVPPPTAAFVPAAVAPLKTLAAPDAWVQLTAPLTRDQHAAVVAIPALKDLTLVATGSVEINGHSQPAVAVDPSSFRRVTPRPTASSDALWASVAQGNLAGEITHDALPSGLVGAAVTVHGRGTRMVRLGALAAFGLPRASVVMSASRGTQLGLAPQTGLIISAPTVSPQVLIDELTTATGGHVDLLGPDAAEADIAGGTNTKGLPATWNGLFQQAAGACPGLSWTVLAAIGQIESGDGQNDGPSRKGAIGPMQFLPGTFAEYAVDGDHDGKKNPLDAYDAVPTAARMLCADGAGAGGAHLKSAVFNYNHADAYVAEVLALAARYR